MLTENPTMVTDEQNDARYKELLDKPERTEDENKELDQLKTKYSKRVQERIDKLTWEKNREREEREKIEKEKAELEERLKKIESSIPPPEPIVKKETVEIAGKKFYTDEMLSSLVKAGKMTENEAYQHQQERIEESAAERAYQRMKNEQKQEEEKNVRKEDAQTVLKEYPHFSKDHKDFNPDDPLYKEAIRIYNTGYFANPRGLSFAIQEAKKVLGKVDARVDISDEHHVNFRGTPPEKEMKKEIPLTEQEKEWAISQFVSAGEINPDTKRRYTEAEACAKAQRAKNERLASRRVK